jgi:hypothetical protein
MSFSYEFDDMQKKIFNCMQKFENDLLIEEIEDLMKIKNREVENLIKIKHFFDQKIIFEILHITEIFFACHQIHTKITLNDGRMKMIY